MFLSLVYTLIYFNALSVPWAISSARVACHFKFANSDGFDAKQTFITSSVHRCVHPISLYRFPFNIPGLHRKDFRLIYRRLLAYRVFSVLVNSPSDQIRKISSEVSYFTYTLPYIMICFLVIRVHPLVYRTNYFSIIK